MCFSLHADVAAGLALTPIGVLALREVRCWREVPFASLPLLFAIHQLVEALVWAGANGDVSRHVGHAAAVAYVIYALPVLPTLMPVAVLLLEPHHARLRVAPFVVLGLVVSAYLTYTMITHSVTVSVHSHALAYGTGVSNGGFWTVMYVIAVIGPSILSGYRSIVAFGVVNLIGLVAVAVVYISAFASFWCILAGMASVLVLLHMLRRRRLPDADRMRGIRTLIPRAAATAHTP